MDHNKDPHSNHTQENETDISDPIIIFSNEDIQEGIHSSKNNLVGKFLTDKAINTAWEEDMEKVLKESPWIFRHLWLLFKRWCREDDPIKKNLDEAEMKVQIWGLPKHCKTTQLRRKIAATLGDVKECKIFEITREHLRFIKATMSLKTNKPLLHGINIGSKEDGLLWVA
ncbi:hypothetical protein PIB30_074134 [Stylosanthes scabra]|uniref:DUF4283 domain-containing protein n=1 Tax=Stylosanthes scabra TaxID=79078 RepID=A0ABU6XPA1_9FABA|nr:hypothetical protein [Stylosanthes scabra]